MDNMKNNDRKGRYPELYRLLDSINGKLDAALDRIAKKRKLRAAKLTGTSPAGMSPTNRNKLDEGAKTAAKRVLYVADHPDTSLAKKYKIKEKDILNKRRGFSERLTYGIVFVIFAIYAISMLAPIYYLIVNSLEHGILSYNNKVVAGHAFALPKDPVTGKIAFNWGNYWKDSTKNVFKVIECTGKSWKTKIGLGKMLFNSVWFTVGTAVFGIISSSFSAYALSRYKFIGRNFIYGIAIFTMTVPIIGSLGASFKLISKLNLMNTPLYLVTAFGGLGFNFLVLYGFFKNLSWSYAEAVFIDGGGHFTAFFRIMLPQAKSSIFTLFLMAFIGSWNDYQTPLLYLPDYQTLASGLYRIQGKYIERGKFPQLYAGLFVSMVPVIILFACFSQTIMKNFTMGGLKG